MRICSRRNSAALLCALLALALAAGVAQGATVRHPQTGKLPGFPAIRGVVPVLGSSAATAAHERIVNAAFAAVRGRFAQGLKPVQNPGITAQCVDEAAFLASHDVCYRGGPVLHDPTIHLIFWQGLANPPIGAFPSGYMETVERYFSDIAAESGQTTNVFAVDPQYGEEATLGQYTPGEYALKFASPADVTIDGEAFPVRSASECKDESELSKGACLLDSDIHKEVEKVAKTSEQGLGDVYVVLTPPGVGGCFDESSSECAYQQYCAYHGDFGGDGMTPGKQTLYMDLPYVGKVEGCEAAVRPHASSEGADGAIDDASHELNETITDPIGSQCDEQGKTIVGCERNAWTDVVGQEVDDKCLPPESTVKGSYGEPLGEIVPGLSSSGYNQLINGDGYWTQRVWSNEAGVFEGACVQRAIGASFGVSPGAAATVPVTLNGSSSGAPGDPAVYWVWSFGEGEQVGTASATIAHTFTQGEHSVGLTAYDAYGSSQGTIEVVSVGPAPIPPPAPPPAPSPSSASPAPVVAYSAAQIAQKLGLPASKATLIAGSTIALGHGECPPACGITVKLFVSVPTTVNHRRVFKQVAIGSLKLVVAAKSSRTLSLSLNAAGRKLLREKHKLVAQLSVIVAGQEGGTWTIARALTLTSKH